MLFSDDFVAQVAEDPLNRVFDIIRTVEENVGSGTRWSIEDHQSMIEGYALIIEMIKASLLPFPLPGHNISGQPAQDCPVIRDYLRQLRTACTAEAGRLNFQTASSRFSVSLGKKFRYEFSQGDLTKIQALINELRDLISANTEVESEHQQRLLMRLEKLQAELHKKMSDLDRFWGLIGEAGVAIGKFGTNAKPIVDRIKEITEIVWQTQSRAEELPSGTKPPLLESRRETDND